MSGKVGFKTLLNKLNEEDGLLNEIDDGSLEFDCQYNLLCGLKIKIPTSERSKLNEWKEMTKSVENNLENKKNERNKNLLQEIRKVELRMEKNRLEKMNGDRQYVRSNKTNTFEENEELPFVYKFDKNTRHSSTDLNGEHHLEEKCNSNDVSRLIYENFNGVHYMPGLKKHMESLHTLQSRQKELDDWYGNMQKQLEIEKIRLAEKYEELHLKNIREQQSIIESSQEFLRSASNNNTPSHANANCKQMIINDFDKSKRAPGSFKQTSTSMNVNNSPPIIHSSSLPTFKTSPNKLKSVESECLTSDKISMEYGTPCASPDKNVSKKTFENAIQMNEVKDYYSISTVSTETSTENVVDLSLSHTNKEVVKEPVNEVINVDLQNTGNITYLTDINKEIVSCSNSLSIKRNFEDNVDYMHSKSLPNSPLKNNENHISVVASNSVATNNFNDDLFKENYYSVHSKSTTIPNDRKTVISVPSRQLSSETVDSLEFGRGSFEQLMKDHDLQSLELRRKSRPVKFFNNPFPSEVISYGSYDDEICSSTNTRQITSHSPLGTSITQPQVEQQPKQQEQEEVQQNHGNTYQVINSSVRSNISSNSPQKLQNKYGDNNLVATSPGRSDISSNSPHTGSPHQNRLHRQQNQTFEKSHVNSKNIFSSAVATHQFDNVKLNGSAAVPSDSISMVSNGPDHHITSTPEKFQEKRGVGFLLEISAVQLQEASEDNDTTSPFMKKHRRKRLNDKIFAVAKGFLTRRLLKTLKVQEIIKTIKDTEEFLDDINKENINNQKLADRQLRVRLQDELSTKRAKLHDIFFNMDPQDQMKMLAISRAQIEERNRKKQAQIKQSNRSNTAFSRNIASAGGGSGGGGGSGSGNLSTASQKSIKRRQVNNISDKVQKNKPTSEKGINLKKSNRNQIIESTGANIHVCIAGALKPIQSCTSPTMADRKKTKSPMKTNSVQNRYSKKSSVSKRLDMNAAASVNQSSRFKSNGLSTR